MSSEITILDAGMGKTLSLRGVDIPPTIWSANALLEAPETVVEIHRENIAAGAQIITANTYGVIRRDLEKVGLGARAVELNRLAADLARRARAESGANVRIAGSLPPLNGSFRPDRVLERDVLLPLYREQVAALESWVDLFICETMSHSTEALAAAEAAVASGKPVLVSFTLHDDLDGCLKSGEPLASVSERLRPFKPAGILVNCCLPEKISAAMPALRDTGAATIGGYANAFSRIPGDWLLDGAKETDGSLVMREDLAPGFYADFVEEWLDLGANLAGGCCGTTAEHIEEIHKRVARRKKSPALNRRQ